MNEMKPISNSRNNMYKVAIILLLAYAAFSSAMKDLNRLQEVAGNVQEITSDGLGGLAKVYSATRSLAEGPQLARGPEAGTPTESPRIEVIAAGGSVELIGLEREAVAKSANHGKAELAPDEKQHGDTKVADIKTAKHFRSEIAQAGNKIACDSRKNEQQNFAGKADKDVHLKVLAQNPPVVGFVRRGVQIESDVDVAISSPARTMFRRIIRKAPARAGGAQWPGVSEFKTLNEVMGLRLASAKSDEAETERFVGEVSNDFSFQLLDKARQGLGTDETNEWATHE